MEIAYRTEYGILEIRPTGAMSEEDFKSLSSELKTISKGDAQKWLLA